MTERDAAGNEDERVRQEEEAAAVEAGEIGGPAPEPEGDEASRPVEEGGGGEAEGFEQAERELGETAAHGDSGWNPETGAAAPEVEADESGAAYSDADAVDSTEVTSDPAEGPDDPG